MNDAARERFRSIRTFPSLIKYLRDELDWPIEADDFDDLDLDDLTFNYEAEELGLDAKVAAKIEEIKQLRPLSTHQPWGVFFIKFEPKRLPVVALRRVLGELTRRKRASADRAARAVWDREDLMFISAYGEGEERQITFAHFAENSGMGDLPTLKVLGWDGADTALKLDHVADTLCEKLSWPDDENDRAAWRRQWSSAFELRHREVITTSKALAIRLAELAANIRRRVNSALSVESEKGPLRKLLEAFRAALIHDLTDDDFADMYAQTIAYGLLTARVSRPNALVADNVADMVPITNPFLKELMETFLRVGGRRNGARRPSGLDFDELGVNDVVELLRAANMPAVLRDFGDRNPKEDPVIHFYELFLKEYDPKKRMKRGVFYTPRPVVSYIVRSVHELLRTEFGLEDGLADTTTWGRMVERHKGLTLPEFEVEDPKTGKRLTRTLDPNTPFVQILDPAAGTATFLVEAIDVIHATMTAKWQRMGHMDLELAKLWNDYVPKHLLPRLHGYELMMAPYAIAHMKIGLELGKTEYRFGTEERARVFLTNALEPSVNQLPLIGFHALAHEAAAVNEIKRYGRFTVVIGNPPYSGISSNMSDDAQRIVDAYKFVDGSPLTEKKLWLQDDYVKFIRKGQTTIASAQIGVFGYITNHSYLDNPTFRGMRQSLIGTFPCLRVLDLHGNTTKTEHPPDGITDKNVFDIQQGVAICLATRAGSERGVEHAELWGPREKKYSWLAEHGLGNSGFSALAPDSPYYFFKPQKTDCRTEYDSGWKLNEAMPLNSAGFITARDHFVVDLDREALLGRIRNFANLERSDTEIRTVYFAGRGADKYPDGDTRGWKLPEARRRGDCPDRS